MKKLKSMKASKKLIYILVFFLLTSLFLYFAGYHITVKGALNSTKIINKDSIYLGKAETKSYSAYFYENEDTYDTIIVRRKALWIKSECSFWSNKTDNMIETAGGCHIGDLTSGITTIPIVCKDENVSYITIDADGEKITKDIKPNKITAFTWNRGVSREDIFGTAYDENRDVLYSMNSPKFDAREKNWITWSNV